MVSTVLPSSDRSSTPAWPAGATVTCTLETISFEADSIDAMLAEDEEKLGPIILAKEALQPEGRWDGLRAQLAELYVAENRATDGKVLLEPEYLLSVIALPGG